MVIVEGDPGCGKSMLLAHFLTRATLRPDPTGPQAATASSHNRSDADLDEDDDEDAEEGGVGDESDPSRAAPPFFVTAASPFHSRPFGVWCTILQQWLDFVAAAEKKKGKLSQNKSLETLEANLLSSANNNSNSNSAPNASVSADHSRREASSVAEAGRQARTTLCLELLPHSLRAAHAWRLNALVGVDCEAVRLRSRTATNAGSGGSGSGGGGGGGAESPAQSRKASLVVLCVDFCVHPLDTPFAVVATTCPSFILFFYSFFFLFPIGFCPVGTRSCKRWPNAAVRCWSSTMPMCSTRSRGLWHMLLPRARLRFKTATQTTAKMMKTATKSAMAITPLLLQ